MRIFNYILVMICLILVVYSCENKGKLINTFEPSFSTPESTIFNYWLFLDARDYKKALHFFKSYREKYYDSSLIYPIPNGIESLMVDSIVYKKKLNNKTYEIYYRVRFYSQKDRCIKYFVTGDRLTLTKKGWLIDEVLVR